MFDLSWFRTTLRTLNFPSVYKGFRTNWDFRNMVESINHQKVPPRRFLKSKNAHAMSIISFRHKDAIGRETQNVTF